MLISRSCWCDLTGHQISLYVEHMACLLLVPCALLSIVGLLPSCYPSIVSVAPHVSPSLPSFVSLDSLLVSVVLCWSVVFRCVRVMLTVQTVICMHACLFSPFRVVFVHLCFYFIKNPIPLHLSPRHLSPHTSWQLSGWNMHIESLVTLYFNV